MKKYYILGLTVLTAISLTACKKEQMNEELQTIESTENTVTEQKTNAVQTDEPDSQYTLHKIGNSKEEGYLYSEIAEDPYASSDYDLSTLTWNDIKSMSFWSENEKAYYTFDYHNDDASFDDICDVFSELSKHGWISFMTYNQAEYGQFTNISSDEIKELVLNETKVKDSPVIYVYWNPDWVEYTIPEYSLFSIGYVVGTFISDTNALATYSSHLDINDMGNERMNEKDNVPNMYITLKDGTNIILDTWHSIDYLTISDTSTKYQVVE